MIVSPLVLIRPLLNTNDYMNKFLKLFFYLLLALVLIIVTAFCYLFFRTSGIQPKGTLLLSAQENPQGVPMNSPEEQIIALLQHYGQKLHAIRKENTAHDV